MRGKKAYHHGNLRSTLVREALGLLEDTGVESLSLRAIAKRAGVSQTAPYSHFSSKLDLLSAVAAVGFERFTATMETEAAGIAEPRAHLQSLKVGYVLFALENPALFRLMFAGDSAHRSASEELRQAAARSFETLRAAVVAAHGANANLAALASWSLVHGLAELILNGRVPRPATPDAIRGLVRAVITAR